MQPKQMLFQLISCYSLILQHFNQFQRYCTMYTNFPISSAISNTAMGRIHCVMSLQLVKRSSSSCVTFTCMTIYISCTFSKQIFLEKRVYTSGISDSYNNLYSNYVLVWNVCCMILYRNPPELIVSLFIFNVFCINRACPAVQIKHMRFYCFFEWRPFSLSRAKFTKKKPKLSADLELKSKDM